MLSGSLSCAVIAEEIRVRRVVAVETGVSVSLLDELAANIAVRHLPPEEVHEFLCACSVPHTQPPSPPLLPRSPAE